MKIKTSKIFVIFIITLVLAGGIFFISQKNKRNNDLTIKNNIEKSTQQKTQDPFFVSGWLPYWAKEEGSKSLEGNIDLFTEINPFAYGVNQDGSLKDVMRTNDSPWPKLFGDVKQKNVRIVPTILWGDAETMHKIFSDQTLLNKHVDAIAAMLDKNNFPGVDIDYEGKDIADRDNFTKFLRQLHAKLSAENKTLNCTVEARTQDALPEGFTGTRAMSWANDFSALNDNCNTVRIMAYDQVFQIHRANTFEDPGEIPSAANADSRWVEDNIKYALKFIAPEKLILGIPTYGWEFQFQKISDGYRYTRVKSISFPAAIQEAKQAGVDPVRSAGGELSFVYKASDGQHIVTFEDAESVRQKIDIAKQFNLKGVSLFKIDGLSDPQLLSALHGLVK